MWCLVFVVVIVRRERCSREGRERASVECVECGARGHSVSGHLIWIVNAPSRPSGQLSHRQLTFQGPSTCPSTCSTSRTHTHTHRERGFSPLSEAKENTYQNELQPTHSLASHCHMHCICLSHVDYDTQIYIFLTPTL